MSWSLTPIARVAAIAGGIFLAVACTDERTSLTDPQGEPSFGIALGADRRGLPAGALTYRRFQSQRSAVRFDTTIQLNFTGLDSLSQGAYVIWDVTYDSTTDSLTSFARANGTLRETKVDTSFNAEGDPIPTSTVRTLQTSSWSFGGPNRAYRYTIVPPRALLARPENRALLITLESDPNAARPGDARALWARFSGFNVPPETRVIGATPNVDTSYTTSSPLRFGNFRADAAREYIFGATGRGRLAFFRRTLFAFDSTLARPPKGYYYAMYGVRRDTVTNAVRDTLFLGDLRAPFPRNGTSLRQADSLNVDEVVIDRPPSIEAAYNEVRGDTLAATRDRSPRPWRELAQVLITLEPKLSRPDAASTHVILSTNVPDLIRLGRNEPAP